MEQNFPGRSKAYMRATTVLFLLDVIVEILGPMLCARGTSLNVEPEEKK